MRNSLFCFFVSFFIFNCLNAQSDTSTKKGSLDPLLYTKDGFFYNNQIVQQKDLGQYLKGFELSKIEYKKSINKSRIASGLVIMGLSSSLYGLSQIIWNKNRNLAYTNLITLNAYALGQLFISSSKRHLRKSISNYNQEVHKIRPINRSKL